MHGMWRQHHEGHGGWQEAELGAPFGVRRPLRFLAYRLELAEAQVAQLAAILDELKTERAQAAVDDRRAAAAIADALGSDVLDEARARAVTKARAESAARLQEAIAKALVKIHALLDGAQRQKLAYLIRSGALSI